MYQGFTWTGMNQNFTNLHKTNIYDRGDTYTDRNKRNKWDEGERERSVCVLCVLDRVQRNREAGWPPGCENETNQILLLPLSFSPFLLLLFTLFLISCLLITFDYSTYLLLIFSLSWTSLHLLSSTHFSPPLLSSIVKVIIRKPADVDRLLFFTLTPSIYPLPLSLLYPLLVSPPSHLLFPVFMSFLPLPLSSFVRLLSSLLSSPNS